MENSVLDYNSVFFLNNLSSVSRSATVAIFYLMKTLDLTFDDAHALVKKAREKIKPNDGFISLLKSFEKGNS